MARWLWEVDDEIEKIVAKHTDPDTGEIDPAVNEDLDRLLDVDRPQAILQIGRRIKGEILEAQMIEAQYEECVKQLDKLMKRAQGHRNRAGSLTRTLQMRVGPSEKFEDEVVVVKWRRSKHVAIAEGSDIPEQYMRVTVKEAPDKKKIADALKEGEQIDGCWIQPTQKIVVE